MNGRYLLRYKNSYFWWVVVFVVMLVLSFKTPLGQKLDIAVAPLIQMMQAPVRWAHNFSLWFEASSSLQKKLLVLQETTLKQKAFRQELASARAENKQLKHLLMITKIDDYVWHAARVISRSQEEKSRRLILQTKHANNDDIVVSYEGLVGLVDNAGATHAVVRTILDASIAVPVTMKNSRLAGLVRGDGEHLQVDFIPRAKAPQVGDILIASGAGGVFPSGLPVAVVEKVNAVAGGVFVEVIASPVAYWQREAWLAIASRVHED